MVRREFAGLPIVVENEAGSTRYWHDRDGRESGSVVMRHDYGFIEGHVGTDGDELDCYLGPDEAARFVYVVHQLKAPAFERHDEDKVMLGFASEDDAKVAYLAHRNDGERAYGGMSAIPLETFKSKLERRTGTGKIRHDARKGTPMTLKFIAGRAFAFDADRGADGKVRIDVWDRFTSTGEKIKEGRLSIFDERTLGQMAANWRSRGDKLGMCFNHQSAYVPQNGQPAPALAWYDALAVVIGGKIVATTVLDGSRAPTVQFEAAARGDGLYGFRCEVTELGHELLPNFKFISPMFTDDGRDEQGNEIGYVLYDVAATNTPFQAGCEITFDRGAAGAGGERTMAAKLSKMSKFVKFDNDADDKTIKQAVLSKMEDESVKAMEDESYNYDDGAAALEEMARAYEDAQMDEEGGSEAPHVTMRRMASKFRRMAKMGKLEIEGNGGPGQEPRGGQDKGSLSQKDKAKMGADGDGDADDKAAMGVLQAFAQRLGVQLPINATRDQMMATLQAASVKASDLPGIIDAQVARTLAARDAKRDAAECAEKSQVLMSQLRDDTPEINRKALESLSKDPKTFESAVALAAPFLRPEATAQSVLFSRMTAGGNPLALSTDAARAAAPVASRKVYKNELATFVVDDEAFAAKCREYADAKDGPIKMAIDDMLSEDERGESYLRLIAANRLVKQKHPEMWDAIERNQLQLY